MQKVRWEQPQDRSVEKRQQPLLPLDTACLRRLHLTSCRDQAASRGACSSGGYFVGLLSAEGTSATAATATARPMGWLGSVPRHAALLHRIRVPSARLNPVQRNGRPLQTTTAPSDKGLVPPPARISALMETAVAATSCRYPAKARMMQGTCPQVQLFSTEPSSAVSF